MRIGVDFDNTIVCYDELFHRICLERGLISADLPVSKSEVRNYLRRTGKEDAWTEIQGYVYGAHMKEAEMYSGVSDFFSACRSAGTVVSIISHKTRFPYLGQKYDLHEAALGWLSQNGFFNEDKAGLPRQEVFLELTKEAKLQRIRQRGCTHFIDDLPEFLLEPEFPAHVQRILFDPNGHYAESQDYLRKSTWQAIQKLIFSGTAPDGAEHLRP